MTVDYIVASLPTLSFGQPPALTWDEFLARAGEDFRLPSAWTDLETQLRNAAAEARGGARWKRPAEGCSLYWKNRVASCFAEKDVLRREDALDRVWWDAAGELTPVAEPLGRGAIATYAVRLTIALRRARASREAGEAAFDRLTAATRQSF
jgi:hypothetical protein